MGFYGFPIAFERRLFSGPPKFAVRRERKLKMNISGNIMLSIVSNGD